MISLAYAGLWIFVFTVPWERLIVLPGLSIVTRVTGGLALGLTLFAVVTSGRVRRWRAFHVAGLLFVIWTGIGVWVLFGGGQIPMKLYTFVQLFAVVWIMWELAPSVKRMRGLLTAFLLGAFVPAIATILLYLRVGGALRRFSAGGADENSLAMTLALAFPMGWYLSMTTERPVLRWLCRAYVPVGLFAAALSGSRGGMLAFLVALLVVPLTMKLSPGRLMAAIALLGLSGALVVAYVPDTVIERLGTTGESLESGSLGGRFRFWVAGVDAFTRQPLMGYGVGGFVRAITPELGSEARVAHNSFLSVLVEEGLVGLILYMTMLLSVFYYILHFPPFERRFGLVLLMTLGTAMLPLTWEHEKVAWFVMAALVGISSMQASGPSGTARQPLLRRTAALGMPPVAARP
jgi:O-antigen ligase/polysaccharide polymerase Wzy-like membrane protein